MTVNGKAFSEAFVFFKHKSTLENFFGMSKYIWTMQAVHSLSLFDFDVAFGILLLLQNQRKALFVLAYVRLTS